MSPKTKGCGKGEAAARLRMADNHFLLAEEADYVIDDPNPYWTNTKIDNYVLAGIAAADAICCVELKEHFAGENHADAIALIRKVADGGSSLAKHLATLLGMKTESAYGAGAKKEKDVTRAQRAAEHLLTAARDRVHN